MARTRPNRPSATPPNARQFGVVVALCALVALAASIALLYSELAHLTNPYADAQCDINALIGCGTSMHSPQAHLLWGLPNSVAGIMAFTVLLLVGLLQLSRTALPRWLWAGLVLGSCGGLAWVAYFAYQSIMVFHALCPYCTVVWLMTIPTAVFIVGYALAAGHLPGRELGRHLWSFRWLYTCALLVVLFLAVVIGLRDQIAAVL
ncbi:MAG: vitamin K epoxide reductase family protein [Bowdeniella nasicola]|nr:vitamin K epoxide reductase family protein [Bowdeniella nasicola]